MRIAMHNWMRVEPIETTIRRLARFGYDAIEISGEPARYDWQEVRRLLDQYGLQCWGAVTLMTQGRDLVDADRYVRLGTIQYLKDTISMIEALGGEIFCVVPSTVGKVTPSASPEEEWEWCVEGLREAADWAAPRGIRIGIEPLNRFETYFINRHDQALALVRDVNRPNVGVTLDAFHMNIEEADPLQAIRNTGRYLVDFHVADNNRRPPGDGNWDWAALINTLKEIGYEGALTSEFVLPVDHTPYGERLTEEAEGAAAAHQKFLRDHATGSIIEAYYDRCVEKTIQYLRQWA